MFKPRSIWPYVVLAAVFVACTSAAYVLPATNILAAVTGNVGVLALVGALFQLFRDQAAHEKSIALTRDDQQFQVGVTSHMANVVFDKHVVFCEEYMAKVRETVETLIRNHATLESVGHANALYATRLKHAAWVTTDMSARLSGFEDAVRRIGAMANFVETTRESPQYAEQRAKAIEFVYAEFQRILPQHFGQPMVDGVSSESIEGRVREMLGIEALVDLRQKMVLRAHAAANPVP